MPHRCALGCIASDAVMHVFPNPNKYPDRFKEWVGLVRGEIQTLSDYEIYRKKRICNRHFLDNHRNRNNRLNALAVPTLYLPDYLGKSYGKQNDTTKSSPYVDHSQPLCSNTSLTVTLGKSQPSTTPTSSAIPTSETMEVVPDSEHEIPQAPSSAKSSAANLTSDHNYCVRREPPQYATTTSNALDGLSEVDDIPPLARQVHREECPGIKLDAPDDPVPAMPEVACENDLEIMYEDNAQDDDEYNSDNNKDDNEPDSDHTSRPKYALDEVDTLFISYAASFRKLSAKLQRMLKLDLAKLFARYEMKNLILDKSVSHDKENTYKTKFADKNITKKVTKEFFNKTKRILKTPKEAKFKHELRRPAASLEASGPATSRSDVASVEPDNQKSALSKYLKFQKTYHHQHTSNETQNQTPRHSINSEVHDKPLNISPSLGADKYSGDWEQVSDDDLIVIKVMLPLNWPAKDIVIIPKDEFPS